jgi:hypothetical protein
MRMSLPRSSKDSLRVCLGALRSLAPNARGVTPLRGSKQRRRTA